MQALHSFLSFSDIWPSGFFKVYPEALRSSRLVSVRLPLNTVAPLVKKYKSDIIINNNYKSKKSATVAVQRNHLIANNATADNSKINSTNRNPNGKPGGSNHAEFYFQSSAAESDFRHSRRRLDNHARNTGDIRSSRPASFAYCSCQQSGLLLGLDPAKPPHQNQLLSNQPGYVGPIFRFTWRTPARQLQHCQLHPTVSGNGCVSALFGHLCHPPPLRRSLRTLPEDNETLQTPYHGNEEPDFRGACVHLVHIPDSGSRANSLGRSREHGSYEFSVWHHAVDRVRVRSLSVQSDGVLVDVRSDQAGRGIEEEDGLAWSQQPAAKKEEVAPAETGGLGLFFYDHLFHSRLVPLLFSHTVHGSGVRVCDEHTLLAQCNLVVSQIRHVTRQPFALYLFQGGLPESAQVPMAAYFVD